MIDSNKVFIATPMYGGMCAAPYTVGILDTLEVLQKNGYQLEYVFLGNESLITRARNNLVDKFLYESNAKFFLFVDADIGFCGNDVLKLIRSDKEFICGLYPKKIIDWPRVNNASRMGLTDLENYAATYVVNPVDLNETHDKPLESSIVEVKHAGTGFMMLQRSVFEKLLPYVKDYRISTIKNANGTMPKLIKEFFALDIVGEDKYLLSEDYFFCNLWKQHGGEIYADLSIALSHFGPYQYKGNLYIGGANPGNQ